MPPRAFAAKLESNTPRANEPYRATKASTPSHGHRMIERQSYQPLQRRLQAHLGHARLKPRRCKKWSKLNSLHLGDSLPLEAAALFGASNMNSARGGARTLALPSARRQRSPTVNPFSRRRGSHRTFLLRRSGCLGKRAKPSRHARHFHVAHSSSQCRTIFYLLWSIGRHCLN
jgi:hypothetical protein